MEEENENFRNAVLSLAREGKWKEILELNEDSRSEIARKLLWVWPDEENLKFIRDNVGKNRCVGIASVGCGCGLLEWLIRKATGLPVIGYEVNEEWWKSKYSNPQFIELCYVDEHKQTCMSSDYALLFCYFNNRKAFNGYVEKYEGNVIIIIGPGEGRGTHTDPEPFNPRFEDCKFELIDFQEIKNTKDFIAIYTRPRKQP